MLLLFSVRFMRIGIERLWSAQIRASLHEGSSLLGNLLKGTGLGFALQGATVVMLMVAGLAGAGAIPLVSAVIVALGADMGSALAVQFLQLPVSALGPLAVLVGATAYLRATLPRLRNLGRVVLGLGLIFLSLSIIRTAVAPIGSLDGTLVVVDYFNRDVITAALAGIVLTLVMHSSVAAILTAVAFASHATLGPLAGLCFVLGCNLGSALLPIWLLKYENGRARLVALAVAIVRCGAAIALVVGLALVPGLIAPFIDWGASEAMLMGHLGFNMLLLALAPACAKLVSVLEPRFIGDDSFSEADLPAGVSDDINLALPALKRKLSGMLDLAASMLEELSGDNPDKQAVGGLEQRVNASLQSIRQIYTQLPDCEPHVLSDLQQVLDFAIRVERCGDVLAGKYLTLRLEQVQGDYQFTSAGQAEIAQMVDAVQQAVILAQETVWTGDVVVAERLVRHKQHVTEMEQSSRNKHLARIRQGDLTSLGSSDQHLETIASLKEINSKFATIGYAVLEQHGGLKKTRLKSSISAAVR